MRAGHANLSTPVARSTATACRGPSLAAWERSDLVAAAPSREGDARSIDVSRLGGANWFRADRVGPDARPTPERGLSRRDVMPRSATAPRSSWSQAPVIPTPGETAREWWSGVGHDKAIAALVERLGRMAAGDPRSSRRSSCTTCPPRSHKRPSASTARRARGCFASRGRCPGGPTSPHACSRPATTGCFPSRSNNVSRASASDYPCTCCRVGTSRCSRAQRSWLPTWQLESFGQGRAGDRNPARRR